ncbi:hypothetical protein CWI41_010050 [Ordospora colligata]|nr:hypothetical protein CWI41_010050 [Ordospora colligata]TBU17354.1 hypothetical protein CWI40_010050 [Ordospora colligata]
MTNANNETETWMGKFNTDNSSNIEDLTKDIFQEIINDEKYKDSRLKVLEALNKDANKDKAKEIWSQSDAKIFITILNNADANSYAILEGAWKYMEQNIIDEVLIDLRDLVSKNKYDAEEYKEVIKKMLKYSPAIKEKFNDLPEDIKIDIVYQMDLKTLCIFKNNGGEAIKDIIKIRLQTIINKLKEKCQEYKTNNLNPEHNNTDNYNSYISALKCEGNVSLAIIAKHIFDINAADLDLGVNEYEYSNDKLIELLYVCAKIIMYQNNGALSNAGNDWKIINDDHYTLFNCLNDNGLLEKDCLQKFDTFRDKVLKLMEDNNEDNNAINLRKYIDNVLKKKNPSKYLFEKAITKELKIEDEEDKQYAFDALDRILMSISLKHVVGDLVFESNGMVNTKDGLINLTMVIQEMSGEPKHLPINKDIENIRTGRENAEKALILMYTPLLKNIYDREIGKVVYKIEEYHKCITDQDKLKAAAIKTIIGKNGEASKSYISINELHNLISIKDHNINGTFNVCGIALLILIMLTTVGLNEYNIVEIGKMGYGIVRIICTFIPVVIGIFMIYNAFRMCVVKYDKKSALDSMGNQVIAKMACVSVCLAAAIAEMVMVGIGMIRADQTSIDDINKMMATTVSVLMILSMMRYVMSKNQDIWYHVVILGGSLVIGTMRTLILANAKIREYMGVMNIVMMAIGILMAITCIAVYMTKKSLNDNKILGKSKSAVIVNIIGVVIMILSTVVGCLMQSMHFNVIIDKAKEALL